MIACLERVNNPTNVEVRTFGKQLTLYLVAA